MTGTRRLEITLVILIVLSAGFYARSAAIPPFPERQAELAGEKYQLDLGEPSRWLSAWSVGDGQAFAVIAADPLGDKLAEEIKEPVYRFTRAGYGWLVALASLGKDRLIPFGLALVGALAIVGTLSLAIRLSDRIGHRAWLLLLNPALYIGFGGDTAEPLAILLLTWALASGSAAAAVALGVTRPTYLLAVFRRSRQFWLGAAAASALLLYSILRFGTEQLIPDGGRLDLPLRAYFENPSWPGWLLALAALATIVAGVVNRDWAWVLAGLLVVSLGTDVTREIQNAWRAAGMLPVLWAFGPNADVSGAVSPKREIASGARSA